MHVSSAAPAPREDSGPTAAAPGAALAYTADEAAVIIGGSCKASWLKQQARERKIPHVKIGGAYNFTRAHINDIIATFTVAADDPPVAAGQPGKRARAQRPHSAADTGIVLLEDRPPRTMTRRLQASA